MLAAGQQPRQQELREDLLNCSICYEPFISPKTLPCLHTFCESCLNDHFTAFKSTKKRAIDCNHLPCPTCREEHFLPPEGIPGLKSDFKVGKMVELFKSVQERQGEFDKCDICQQQGTQSKSTHFCGSCSLNFCQNCMLRHNANPLFKGHSATRTKDTQSNLMCKQHPSQGAQHYCSDCKEQVCAMCVFTLHQKHGIVECEVLQRQRLQTLQKPIRANISQMEKKLQDMQKLEKSMTVAYAQSRECVEQARLKLLSQIEEKSARMLSKLSEQESEQRAAFITEQEKCETALAKMQSLQDFSQALLADSENTYYPGLQGAVEEMEKATKSKPVAIPDSLKLTSQFKPNFQLDVGKLVKIDLLQNRLAEEEKATTVAEPKKTQQPPQLQATTTSDKDAGSSPKTTLKSKSKFPFFSLGSKRSKSKSKSKSNRRDKNYCDICESSKYCVCCRQGARPQTPSQNRIRTKSLTALPTKPMEITPHLEKTVEVEMENYSTSCPVEPSAPPAEDEVFDDSGLCDSATDSDRDTSSVSSDEQYQSSEDLVACGQTSMALLCTSDQTAPPGLCIEDEDEDENEDKKKKTEELKIGKVLVASRTTRPPSSPSSSSQSSSSQSSPSSSRAATPVFGRHRSGSSPGPSGFGGGRYGGPSHRNHSLPSLLLTEVLARSSFRT